MSKNKKVIKPRLNPLAYFPLNFNSNHYVGIVKAEEWYGKDNLLISKTLKFVVGSWHDYRDSEKSNFEGLTTIAAFSTQKDAELFFYTKYRETMKKSAENELNYLDESGLLIFQSKTNPNIFAQRAYDWVDRVILIHEKKKKNGYDRLIIGTMKFSDFPFLEYRMITTEEFQKIKKAYSEINNKKIKKQ